MKKISPDKATVNRIISIALVTLICCFALVILLQVSSVLFAPSKSQCTKKVCLAKFMEGPPAFNDDVLKQYIHNKYFYQSHGPLALSGDDGSKGEVFELTMRYIRNYFKDQRDGKFVVLGAGDGEFQDFTLALEREMGWTGLLVEPHPVLFEKLKSKGRNALLSSNCVSPYAYPALLEFAHKKINAVDGEKEKLSKLRGTKLKQLWEDEPSLDQLSVQCIPAENLLYTAGFELSSSLDILVLSMSGTDLDMFLNVAMDKIAPPKMIVVMQDGADIKDDIISYFYESRMNVDKVYGATMDDRVYIITKMKSEE